MTIKELIEEKIKFFLEDYRDDDIHDEAMVDNLRDSFRDMAVVTAEAMVPREETFRDIDLRSGWKSSDSGECCDKCTLEDEHFTGRADALKRLMGCRNPFQVESPCVCHLPIREANLKGRNYCRSEVQALKDKWLGV